MTTSIKEVLTDVKKMSKIPRVKTLEQLNEILKNNRYVFVDFYASWCGPCKKIAPTLIKLSEEYTNVFFCKVNVERAVEVSDKYNIKAMPTFILFTKDGYKRIQGADVDKITKLLESTK